MGNNIVSNVAKIFDRGHLEIESISAKIDRAKTNGFRETHEVCVENIGEFHINGVNCARDLHGSNEHQVHKFV